MKKFMNFGVCTIVMACLLLLTACDNNDAILPDEGDVYAAELVLTESLADEVVTVYVNELDTDASSFEVLVRFVSDATPMRRLYMTENILGAGEQPFKLEIPDVKLDQKGDGSLDIESNQGNEFSFALPFNVLPDITDGTVEYKLWATEGKGDYRDPFKNHAIGIGTIVIDYGGNNPDALVKEYNARLFAVPLADGTSKSFISLLNGEMYNLNQGNEYASFWDFGYYWLNSPGASLASTYEYPALFNHDADDTTPLVAIATLTGTNQEELNHCHFGISSLSSVDFDNISVAADLNTLNVSDAASEKVNNLEVGSVVEFIDAYGKKGLIRVVAIEAGYGTNGSMTIDIKVQP